jgi:hypothetical protein
LQREQRGGKHLGAGLVESPSVRLGVTRVKVGEKIKVGEVPEPGAVISHGIVVARDVGYLRAVSVVASMGAG